ncbi:MAG TPA: recombination mediator RecR [Termitinemataceae bacterium]|uniref:recombination mediator RecR n=1 Tax=Treponema sp. J25 TaxID=2094121 RepID=UPI001043ED81|nr:recombination mediator RecR [Treponema sp. J25]TCW60707.1 recombination protein RecR [Treponema sp. J25]HOJ99178.1 recombination mediator RecR [Termitinemataceae bacterium]HOM23185.1 recombination mediator RecR [Termitinemataceae bacterium]HPQ00371.1 recombination mediator RecR [Termitinemataceae bacterium]
MTTLDNLVQLLAKLPGIGKKTATRLAYHILDGSPSYARELAEQLANLHSRIRRCSRCGNYTEEDPCPICQDPGRDASLLCVVEKPQDIRIIEEGREFRGHYHVLGGLIAPLEGVGPDQLAIGKLLERLRGGHIQEVILALNPTIEGDTTALYLHKLLKDTGIRVTRLASGLPVGGDLEYADRLTLSRSFRGRLPMG